MDIISGAIVALLTQLAKSVQGIPINPTQTGRIRIFAGVLSVLSTLVTAYLSGHLADVNVTGVVYQSAATYLLSVLAYHGVLRS